MKTLKGFPSWEKQRLYRFRTALGIVRVVVEYNNCYGDLIHLFEIGGTMESTVRDKYLPDRFIQFDASASLCGERSLEKGSVVYEFLLKPLGIDTAGYPATGKDGWDILYSEFYEFRRRLLALGGVEIDDEPVST